MDHLRICARVDLDAISHNIHFIRQHLRDGGGDAGIIAVIKADAYGHGALPIASYMEKHSLVRGFAVATYEEARELYDGGIKSPVLILGYTFPHTYKDIIQCGFRPVIFTTDMATDYAAAADACQKKVYCHIKIDTGMSRIGFGVTDEACDKIKKIFEENHSLVPEGIFTHFARADEADKTPTRIQTEAFETIISKLEKRGLTFPIVHASNSAAILEYDKAWFDCVRAGIIIYGLMPSDEVQQGYDLRPVLSLYSRIVMIKEIKKGTAVSYGGTYIADQDRRIATIPVGYADGYSRGLSGKGAVLIHKKRAPIIGRICMDQLMVDVTDIPEASLFDEVTLIGSDGDEKITLEELGDQSGRFNYEFACCLGNRIPRLYYSDGELIDTKEYY